MTVSGWIELVVLVVVLTGLTPVVGGYMARVYQGERVPLTRVLAPTDRALYALLRVERGAQQDWKQYAQSLLLFSLGSWLLLYLVLRTQSIQPFNPQGFTHSEPWDLSFNTASSFVSNTSWQYYAGERRCRTSPRWPASPWPASPRWPPAWPPPWRSSAGSPGGAATPSGTSGSTSRARSCTWCCRFRSSPRSCSSPPGSRRRSSTIRARAASPGCVR